MNAPLAVARLQEHYPEVDSLRDVSPEQLEAVAPRLPEVVMRRARHVVTEDARVGRFVEAARPAIRAHGPTDDGVARQPARRL